MAALTLICIPHIVHSSSPFTLMFGHGPISCSPLSQDQRAHDTSTYLELNRKRLAEIYEIVDANLTQAGEQQKRSYDKRIPKADFPSTLVMQYGSQYRLNTSWRRRMGCSQHTT